MSPNWLSDGKFPQIAWPWVMWSAPITPAYPTSITPESAMFRAIRNPRRNAVATASHAIGVDGLSPAPGPRKPIQIIRASR